jgi:hypothetical protein
MERERIDLDLGSGHRLIFIRWAPDRILNPQYDHVSDVEKWGAVIEHTAPDGKLCEGCITFDGPVQREVEDKTPKWTVESWEPLTVSPSLLCVCGDHGFIRNGKWVPA